MPVRRKSRSSLSLDGVASHRVLGERLDGATREDTALSAVVNLNTDIGRNYVKAMAKAGKGRGTEAWKWHEKIGEVQYAVSRSAKVAGYAQLGAYKLNADGTIGDRVSRGPAAEIASRLYSPYGGQRAFIDRWFTLSKIPGDAWLIRCRDTDGDLDGYDWLDAAEIDDPDSTDRPSGAKSGLLRVTYPGNAYDGQFRIPIADDDMLGRVWRPAARFVEVAQSPMSAIATECEELYLLTQGLKGKLLSRLALNGILFIPNSIHEIQSAAPSGQPNNLRGVDKVIADLITAATMAVLNHDDPRGALPIFMKGDPAAGEKIQHIMLKHDILETDIKLRAELIDRILNSLDVSAQGAKGASEVSNHWGAWAAGDDERRVNVQPDLEMMCWALTRMVLHREMAAAGISPATINKYVIWFDLSKASVKTNQAEDARQLIDRIIINPKTGRQLHGIDESAAPTGVEYIRMVGVKNQDPYLATFGMPEQEEIDWTKVKTTQKTGPTSGASEEDPSAGPGNGDPGSPDDRETDVPRSQRPA